MKFKFVLIFFSLSFFSRGNVFSQYWYGYSSTSHAGVNALPTQPASSLSSPYRYDIHLFGVESYSITTDAFPLAFKILKEDPALFLAENHQHVEGETMTFPSFIWKINDKNAVGFDMKLRSVFAIDPIESSLIELLTDYIFLGQSDFNSDEQLISRSSAWFEAGFNYSRNLISHERHKLNIGITPKIILGQGSANLMVENVDIKQNVSTGMVDITGLVGLQYSQSIDDWKEDDFKYIDRASFAFSTGMEYLYYADPSNTYKFKVGLSVLDIGKMKYERSMHAGTFRAENLMVDPEVFNSADLLNTWAELVRNLFEQIPEENEKLEIALPTKFGIQLDYHIFSGFYVNASSFIALDMADDQLDQAPNFNTFVLTPRFERRNWGVALPLRYDEYSGYATGASAFWGPVYLGVSNFFEVIFSSDNESRIGGYFGVKIGRLWEEK